MDFPTTNNEAEYEALLAGMRAAASLGIRRLLAKGDSELVINEVSKEYQCSDLQMAAYLAAVRNLEKSFDGFEAQHIKRHFNLAADELSKLASLRATVPLGIFQETL